MGRLNGIALLACVVLTIGRERGSEAARILGLFPLPGKSHFVMCETLLRGLVARGHRVDVVGHFPLANPPANYHDISLNGTMPGVVNNMTLRDAEKFSRPAMRIFAENVGTELCDLLDVPQIQSIIKNPPTDPPYDIVIYELFAADCYLAFGRHLNVSVVGVATSKLFDWLNDPLGNPQSAAFVPSIFSGFGQRMNFRERLQNFIMINSLKLRYWFHAAAQLAYVEKHFHIKLSSTRDLYDDVAVMLVNTHPSLDFIRPLVPGIVEVGGLHVADGFLELTPEVKKWLDESKDGCVYFSFGSMLKIESFPNETIRAFYESFERIAPVRVLMKIAKREELAPGLPSNVMTSPWLPQPRVLQHPNIKAFVTHGGLMSTQEAITYGVPMIGVPIFGDQHVNVRLCEEKRVALWLKYYELTADSFTEALKTVLNDPSYSASSKHLAKLFIDRPVSALETAIFWVEHVIRNGNVLGSPAADLSWWQVELLDVYVFLLAVTLLALYAAKRLLGFALRSMHSKLSTAAAAKSKKND